MASGIKKYQSFLESERHGRAFIIGCAVFIAEMLFLSSMQSAFAEDRESIRDVPGARNSAREISTPSPAPSVPSTPSATPTPPSPAPQPSDSLSVPTVPSVKSIKRSSSTTPLKSFVGNVPAITSNTSSATMIFGAASLAFSEIGATTHAVNAHADLGAHIKYCIVFPILNAAGSPIPQFDVPVCPGATTTPPGSAPLLTVVKTVINDDTGSATTSDFTLRVNSTTVLSGVTRVFSPGSYVVSEATTTVTVGTTTIAYTQSFSGDCDASGNVTLGLGDNKTCTIINDDPGPGGQGGNPDDGGGNGSNPGDGGSGNGNDGDSDGGGSRGGRGGRVAGASNPEFLGGADGIPGTPNTGGGDIDGNMGLLIFSFVSTVFGVAYMKISLKNLTFFG